MYNNNTIRILYREYTCRLYNIYIYIGTYWNIGIHSIRHDRHLLFLLFFCSLLDETSFRVAEKKTKIHWYII